LHLFIRGMKLNMVKSILLGAKWIAWPDAL